MPRQKTPISLRRMGLEKLASLVEKLRMRNVDESVEGLSLKEVHCDSYFIDCPGTILEDLIDLLHWQQPSGIDFFQLEQLLGSNLRRLWLHYSDSKSLKTIPLGFQRILRRLAVCGEQIVDLSLKGCILWNNEELIKTLQVLHNLRRLVLYSSKIDDDVLETIGNSCCNLEELQVSGWNITDYGLRTLTVKPLPLKVIVIDTDRNYSPKITINSIIHLLQRLPHLEIFKIPLLTEAIVKLHELNPESSLGLHLYHDDLDGETHTKQMMESVVHCCPLLNELWINVADSETLLTLKGLTYLTSLVVTWTNSEMSGRVFMEGLIPVLELVGSRITHLEISLDEIDLSLLDNCCPILEEFECTRFTKLKNSKEHNKPFPYLKSLKLFPEETNYITRDNLIYLLSGCNNLQTLFIGWCDWWNDQTIYQVLHKNPLKQLREIEMSDLYGVTVNGLQLLLLAESDLQTINILYCDSISLHDVNILRNLVKALNLDVQIKYYE